MKRIEEMPWVFSDDRLFVSNPDTGVSMTVQEFIVTYGEQYLPESPTGDGFVSCPVKDDVFSPDRVPHYYEALWRLVHACGNGTVRAQKNAADIYRGWCLRVQVKPILIGEDGTVRNRLYDKAYRQRIYYRIRKYKALGLLKSFYELEEEVEESFKRH